MNRPHWVGAFAAPGLARAVPGAIVEPRQARKLPYQGGSSLIPVSTVAAVVGLLALYWSYRSDLVLTYADSLSHLNIARRVLDSRTPGLVQLGTVWLPVPHILLQPVIYSDPLWHTGLAGSIVGLVCFVITAVTLFLSIRLTTRHVTCAWLGLAVFLFNPNVLYLQTTALTEPVLLMAMTGSTYFLLRWSYGGAIGDLAIAGFLAMMAVGSRYDGWFLTASSGLVVFLTVYFRSRKLARAESVTLTYVLPPIYGMLMWIFYNWLIFGDPLAFQRSEFSASFQQEQIARAGGLPTKHNLALSTLTYSWAVVDVLGGIILIVALGGMMAYLASSLARRESLVPYLFLSPYPFNILALWLGQTTITTPHSEPPGYFNLRYGTLILPGAAFFAAYLADFWLRRLRLALVVPAFALVLTIQFMLWIPGWPTSIATVAEGLIGSSAKTKPYESAKYLHDHYAGGGILIDDNTWPQFVFESHIAMQEYIGTFSEGLWKDALNNPAENVKWIVLRPGNEVDRVAIGIDRGFARHYTAQFEDSRLTVYRRNGD